jgi:hypothetical protein
MSLFSRHISAPSIGHLTDADSLEACAAAGCHRVARLVPATGESQR